MMEQYQHDFIEFALAENVLLFGEFKLKSGRISPYFFNAGLFNTGNLLAKLGHFYSTTIHKANIEFDILFGPAYKGIPLVSAAAISLSELYQQNKPFCFNRKEKKEHGEGGEIIGSPLQGKVLIIDDVISAGTTFHEALRLVKNYPAKIVGMVTAIDRQERGMNHLAAAEEIEKNHHVKCISIIKMAHIIEYLASKPKLTAELERIKKYQHEYGV